MPRVAAPPNDHFLAELVALSAEGDAHASERLFLLLLPRVRNLVRYLVRDDPDVDDLAQDALVTLFRGLPSYRGEGSFKAWADRVVARSVFGAIERRRARAEPLTGEQLETSLPDTRSGSQSYLWRRSLAASLDKLPWEQRQSIVLHFVLGMTVPEVAQEAGVPPETVRSRLRLGMTRLKSRFQSGERRRVG